MPEVKLNVKLISYTPSPRKVDRDGGQAMLQPVIHRRYLASADRRQSRVIHRKDYRYRPSLDDRARQLFVWHRRCVTHTACADHAAPCSQLLCAVAALCQLPRRIQLYRAAKHPCAWCRCSEKIRAADGDDANLVRTMAQCARREGREIKPGCTLCAARRMRNKNDPHDELKRAFTLFFSALLRTCPVGDPRACVANVRAGIGYRAGAVSIGRACMRARKMQRRE